MPFCRLRIEGTAHVADLQGPVIFMANHRSYLDSAVATFAIPAHLRTRLGIAAATEVLYRQYAWAVPLGELSLNAFPFPTGVNENIRPGLDYIGRMLDDAWNVLIFPEGRMNRTDEPLQDLKGGTGVIAVEMGVPIVPMAIHGTERIMPPGTVVPRSRAEVAIRFGQALRFGPEDGYDVGTARIQAALRELLRDR
jgi:long-chain acyl-CoA synthetase